MSAGWPLTLICTAGYDKNGASLVAPMIVSAVLVAGILALLEGAASTATPGREELGYLQAILGADGRISTSKTVVFLWTLILAAVLTQLTIVVVFSTGLEPTKIFGSDWGSVLLLLCGPFASAVRPRGTHLCREEGRQRPRASRGDHHS